jgi:hypothetical protein
MIRRFYLDPKCICYRRCFADPSLLIYDASATAPTNPSNPSVGRFHLSTATEAAPLFIRIASQVPARASRRDISSCRNLVGCCALRL